MASHYDEDRFIERYQSRFGLKLDNDWSYRERRLHILQKFLNGSIYDNLEPYHHEYMGGLKSGNYVPLAQRRPSVIYKIPKVIVDNSTSMLFGEEHFPTVRCEHDKTSQFLQYITRVCNLKMLLLDAARKGSIGSVVIFVQVLEGKFYFEALHTTHLTPTFKRTRPDELEKLVEKKKVDGSTLASHGYTIPKDDLQEQFYIMREWNENEEIYYIPYKVSDDKNPDFKPSKDKERSTRHDLGFVTCIWIKNLPKSTGIDGHSTFEDIIDICIEIDYQLSQNGRMLKYNADPTMVIKNPQDLSDTQIIKGIQPIIVDENGDAKLLEITNGATSAVLDYVRQLRDFAIEMVRGNRANPDKLRMAQSGEALKMLNFELLGLVEELRLTYGEFGLINLYGMILKICNSNISIDYPEMPDDYSDCENHILLDWPQWFPMSMQDKLNEAGALVALTTSKILSNKTATASIADEYNILDVDDEINQIDDEKEAEAVEQANEMAHNKSDKSENAVDRQSNRVDREKK